jgi:biopolymer transport protein ExbD
MNWYGRLDVIVLALMLAYVVTVVTRVSYRLARRMGEIDPTGRSRKNLAADLSSEVGILKAIASIAPYLGLAGTCLGILSAFRAIAMERHAAMVMIVTTIGAAFVTTAAGILVAVPATCFYNYLCTRLDLLESEVSNEEPRHFPIARRFRLTKRFSELPGFALIAAPGLAILITGYMTFASFHPRTGFSIELAPTRCEDVGDDRLIVLHITDAGKLFLNAEPADWNGLAGRLSEIYSVRAHHTLYLVADDGIPFQTVADALDTVENAPATVSSQATGLGMDKLDITVRLVTPRALNAGCSESVVTGSSQHASK